MSYSKNYTDADWKIIIPYQWCINRSLWNEVIPSLRKVIMEWDNQTNTICFYFYHDGPITQLIEKHYSYIHRLAHFQGLEMEVNTNYKIIRSDYPECIPQREFVIYSRREPFVDPVNDLPLPKGEAACYRESYEREKPFSNEIVYSDKDWDIIGDFRWYISGALQNEVIPSLRQVAMQWDPEEKIIWFLFYHDGPITDIIAKHYWYIDTWADCDGRKGVKTSYKIIRIDYPQPIPKESFIIYARKEPFVNP